MHSTLARVAAVGRLVPVDERPDTAPPREVLAMWVRFAKSIAAALLVTVLSAAPALAQAASQQQQGKPVGQYILLVVLLAIPIGLVCRSSRR